MLKRLHVENYGLIDRADVDFAQGATIFTGETGSGKTMLVGALSFALGARADAASIREGAERSLVELTFEPDAELLRRLREEGYELEPGEEAAILRELTRAGKSSVRLCGRSVTAGYVRELGPQIAEIVGQHEAQRLLSSAYHLEMLDRFAGDAAMEARAAVSQGFARAAIAREALARHEAQELDASQRVEEERRAREEIRATSPQSGEDERLTARRRYLDNVERVATALRSAHDALAADDAGAVSALGTASAALAAVRAVSPELAELASGIAALQSEASDLATSVSRALDETEYDPAELESINGRLDALDRLKRKYGGSIEAALAYAERAERLVGDFERRDEIGAHLRDERDAAESMLREQAERLGNLRRAAAKKLEQRVVREFSDLALGSGSFRVSLEPLAETGRSGAERVEFLFSANAGEAPRPLARIVSGGELSRVLLALVVSLAQARERTALVFDEIDAGIGGATALAVGARIGRLAKSGQVVCITHLAQLATYGQRHYVLEKHERLGTTTIGVREIETKGERTQEIARMLSGETKGAALKHAQEMLSQTQ